MQGRDANRNLQRSLKVARLRERLLAVVQQLAGAVTQWQDERGAPFAYDGRPLLEMLDTLLEEIQEEARQRVEHSKKQVESLCFQPFICTASAAAIAHGIIFSREAEEG